MLFPLGCVRRQAVVASAMPPPGWGTLSVAPFAGSLDDRLHVVRTMAELMGETGL